MSKSPAQVLVGEVVGDRYLVESVMGSGAMATVYRARHIKFRRPVAIKVLHPHLASDPKMLARFDREAQLSGRLRHLNVASVSDSGETAGGLHYMVMELVEGVPLSVMIMGPMNPVRVVHIVKQLCDGLAYAHAAGIVHRDLKPDNIIVGNEGTVDEVPRIVDFGVARETLVPLRVDGLAHTHVARITSEGLVFGTPAYMAPEQACGIEIDHRVDLYALGVIMFEMLTGRVPFDGEGMSVARKNVFEDTPSMEIRVPFLDVDPLLEEFVDKLMMKNRDRRLQTATEARSLLELIERDRSEAARLLGVTLLPRTKRRTAMPPLDR